MAFSRVLAVSLAAAALARNHTCGLDGECNDEESSLLQNFLSKEEVVRAHAPQTPWWEGKSGYSKCRNRYGVEFPCGEYGKCCGDVCMNENDVCCMNILGDYFPCGGEGGGCCGNACYAPGSKCCRVGPQNEWYPVSKDTECRAKGSAKGSGSHKTCRNRYGDEFWCGADSKCCGDICVAAGGKCCENAIGYKFGCGEHSQCCGNACAGSGSKCCKPEGPCRSRDSTTWHV